MFDNAADHAPSRLSLLLYPKVLLLKANLDVALL